LKLNALTKTNYNKNLLEPRIKLIIAITKTKQIDKKKSPDRLT